MNSGTRNYYYTVDGRGNERRCETNDTETLISLRVGSIVAFAIYRGEDRVKRCSSFLAVA